MDSGVPQGATVGTAMSAVWRRRALHVTPGGTQTRSKHFCDGTYPTALTEGQGARVWDVNGHEYVDWICALGAVSLGYAYPPVNQAVRAQLHAGVSFSLPHRLEAEYAEELLAALGWPEQVRFVKTGSEATEGALLMARRATGRDLVVSVGYHGWHAIHQPGPSLASVSEADVLPALSRYWKVAAVLIEVGRQAHPEPGWLKAVRDRCTELGTLMILDECVTGFRWALGGAGEFYGVQPDLACFGKAMANGFPLAAIVGPRHLMEYATMVSSTFGGDAVALAAARATLDVYRREPVIEHMWKVGAILQQELNTQMTDRRCLGVPVHPRIEPCETAFLEATAAKGVLLHPAGFNVSYTHTMDEVARTVEACR